MEPVLVLACLIGISRLYLYVHYPTDVLGGVWQALYQDIWDIGSSRPFFTE